MLAFLRDRPDMTTNWILGATGAVGEFLLPRLAARGERIVALSRNPPGGATSTTVEWQRGDLFGAMPPLPASDAIYSLGPLDAFSRWFVPLLDAGAPPPRALIAIGSMSAESKQESTVAAERSLAARLRAAEACLLDAARRHDVACTILRPTLVYGSGRDRSLAPLARFARRWRVLPIPRDAHGLRQPVHAGDLAQACIGARDAAGAAGRIYALGGGERLRFDEMLARIAALPPRVALAMRIPISVLAVAARVMRTQAAGEGALSRLKIDLVADNAEAMRDLRFAPRAFRADEVLPRGRGADAYADH